MLHKICHTIKAEKVDMWKVQMWLHAPVRKAIWMTGAHTSPLGSAVPLSLTLVDTGL